VTDDTPPEQPPDAYARQRAVILAFGRRMTANPSVLSLMRDAVTLMAETLDFEMGACGQLGDDGQLNVRAYRIVDGQAQELGEQTYSSGNHEALLPFALETATTVTSEDIANDGRISDGFLTGHAARGAIAIPLLQQRQCVGAVALLSSQPRKAEQHDLAFCETLGHLLSTTIARSEAETRLANERTYRKHLLDTVGCCVFDCDARGEVLAMNQAARDLSNYNSSELAGRPFWNAFAAPREIDVVHRIFTKAFESSEPTPFESWLRCKNGQERRMRWKVARLPVKHYDREAITLAGIDVTETAEGRRRISDLERAVENAKQSISGLTRSMSANSVIGVAPRPPAAGEQRQAPRRAYAYMQRIAPVSADGTPSEEDFRDIQFRDLSASGVSFVLSEEPKFRRCVVELGAADRKMRVLAEVARTEVSEHQGRKVCLVGCRFIGRLGADAAPDLAAANGREAS